MTNILDCGHAPTKVAAGSISNGIARDIAGNTLCYECATKWIKETAEETGKTVAYVSSDGRNIITWNGDVLGTVIMAVPASGRRTFYRARLFDGKVWYGWGPAEVGTYVSLRRYKGE